MMLHNTYCSILRVSETIIIIDTHSTAGATHHVCQNVQDQRLLVQLDVSEQVLCSFHGSFPSEKTQLLPKTLFSKNANAIDG